MPDARDFRVIRVISVPYDSGHRGARMGRGPEHLLNNGLPGALREDDRDLRPTMIESKNALPAEVATAFELDALVSGEVRGATDAGEFPLVLSGNCGISVGTLAGLGARGGLGVVWFDAHADFNTPETTTTGFSDGMGVAVAVGHCWKAMASGVPGFSPLPEADVVLVGTRDVEPAEQRRLEESEVAVIEAGSIKDKGVSGALDAALDALRARTERVYVHLDLDVLDPEEVGPANGFAAPGGLAPEGVKEALRSIRERFAIAAAGIASYDPTFDPEGKVLDAALGCVQALVDPA